MKKITFLLAFVAVAMFANASDVVFTENFGTGMIEKTPEGYWPYISQYTAYDNVADCSYDGLGTTVRAKALDGAASTVHVIWFQGAKPGMTLSIGGIPTAGYDNMKVAFKVANSEAAGGDVSLLKLSVNGTEVALTGNTTLGDKGVTNTLEANIPAGDLTALGWNYPNGASTFCMTNVVITGTATTAIKNVTIDNSVYATNGTVYAEGEFQIFSVAGQNVTELNGQLNGIYVVKTAKGIQKVAVK